MYFLYFKFLQYTIHFINECDIFIRKLQQQHQIKANQNLLDEIASPNKSTTPTSRKNTLTQQEPTMNSPTSPTPRRTKNSLKTADLVVDTTLQKTDAYVSELMVEPEKYNQQTAKKEEVVGSKVEVETEAEAKDSPNNIINQQLSAKLLKSIPTFSKPSTLLKQTTSSPTTATYEPILICQLYKKKLVVCVLYTVYNTHTQIHNLFRYKYTETYTIFVYLIFLKLIKLKLYQLSQF